MLWCVPAILLRERLSKRSAAATAARLAVKQLIDIRFSHRGVSEWPRRRTLSAGQSKTSASMQKTKSGFWKGLLLLDSKQDHVTVPCAKEWGLEDMCEKWSRTGAWDTQTCWWRTPRKPYGPLELCIAAETRTKNQPISSIGTGSTVPRTVWHAKKALNSCT